MQAEQITDIVTDHGEGPVWHPRDGLCVVDLLAGDVVRIDTAAGTENGRWHVGEVAAVVRPTADDGYVIATRNGFVTAPGFGAPFSRTVAAFADRTVRFNDGGCDPAGNFYAGTMAYDKTPGRGRMYRLDRDGVVTSMFGDLTVSNGLAWTADGTRAYYNDTRTHRVDVFDWDEASGLHNRRPFVAIPPEQGSPDGLTVDAAGGVWVALWGGGAVHHYSPEAHLADLISVPATNVSACTFGGADLSELFITTSRHDSPDRAAGAVFRVRPGVVGYPALPYRPSPDPSTR